MAVLCPRCLGVGQVDPALVGKKIRCSCGMVFTVPPPQPEPEGAFKPAVLPFHERTVGRIALAGGFLAGLGLAAFAVFHLWSQERSLSLLRQELQAAKEKATTPEKFALVDLKKLITLYETSPFQARAEYQGKILKFPPGFVSEVQVLENKPLAMINTEQGTFSVLLFRHTEKDITQKQGKMVTVIGTVLGVESGCVKVIGEIVPN